MIVWFIAILCLTTVNGQCSDGCPFPEFSARMVKLGSKLPNLTHPQCPGDVLTFKCINGWQIPTDQSAALICQENGKWNATLPRCDKKLSSGDWDDKVQYYDDQSDPPGWHPFTNDLSLMFYDAAVFRLSMAAASISEVMVSAMKSQPNPNQKRMKIPDVVNVTVDDSICTRIRSNRRPFRFNCQHKPKWNITFINISLSHKSKLESLTFLINEGIPSQFSLVSVDALTVTNSTTMLWSSPDLHILSGASTANPLSTEINFSQYSPTDFPAVGDTSVATGKVKSKLNRNQNRTKQIDEQNITSKDETKESLTTLIAIFASIFVVLAIAIGIYYTAMRNKWLCYRQRSIPAPANVKKIEEISPNEATHVNVELVTEPKNNPVADYARHSYYDNV